MVKRETEKKRKNNHVKTDESLHRLNRLYAALTQFNEAIIHSEDPQEIFNQVCDVAVSYGLFRFAWVGIADEPDGNIRQVSGSGIIEGIDFKSMLSSLAKAGHSASTVKSGKSFISNNARKDPRLSSMQDMIGKIGVKSIAAFPISKNKKPFAALILGSSQPGIFDKEEITLIEGVVENISHSIDRHEEQRKRLAAEFELRELNAELEDRIRQAESATMRAQTYLDFMSHDLSNILTPVMTYAEMFSSDERVPLEDRKYGSVVVDQVDRASKFISRVKKLAIAETMPLEKIESADLRESFLTAQSEVFRRYPGKKIEIAYSFFEDTPIFVTGGDLIESVIEEILDNAIKYSNNQLIDIKVIVTPELASESQTTWKIEISDNGPGISPRLRATLLAEAFAEEKRLSRGIATGLPFMALIISHLGGKLIVEDRVPGDYSKGTNIIIIIPGFNP